MTPGRRAGAGRAPRFGAARLGVMGLAAFAETLMSHDHRSARLEFGHEMALASPTARNRTARYTELIDQEEELV